MAEREWPGTGMLYPASGGPSGAKTDQALFHLYGRAARLQHMFRTLTAEYTLTAQDQHKLMFYHGATDTIWRLPAGINQAYSTGLDQNDNNKPLTGTGVIVNQIWQGGNGKVTFVPDPAYTVVKLSSFASIRTDGPATGIGMMILPNGEGGANFIYLGALNA
jgi:hypothetical protein